MQLEKRSRDFKWVFVKIIIKLVIIIFIIFMIAMKIACQFGWNSLWLETDSTFVVLLVKNNSYKVPWRFRYRWIRALQYARKHNVRISHIYREITVLLTSLSQYQLLLNSIIGGFNLRRNYNLCFVEIWFLFLFIGLGTSIFNFIVFRNNLIFEIKNLFNNGHRFLLLVKG